MARIGNNILEAADFLRKEEIIGIPTETVYGLAGNALKEVSILKIFKAKNRPKFDPLIAHVPSIEAAKELAGNFPGRLLALAEEFWPGPLTLLVQKRSFIPDLLTSGSPLVAVRVPAHPLAQKLLAAVPFPLAAPSANPFGYVSPTSAQHVEDQLGTAIPYILDGGSTPIGLESTIVSLVENKLTVHRLGGLSIENIEAVAGKVELRLNQSSNPVAPGMLKSHYSPSKPVVLGNIASMRSKYQDLQLGILSFSEEHAGPNSYALSPDGNIDEAASRLFTTLRQLDRPEIDLILAEPFPDEGLGKAINDRLQRAAAPK